MVNITELTMLLRGRVELPGNLTFTTEEFREGWNFVRSGGARRLDKEVRRRGWHFIRIGEGALRRANTAGSDSRRAEACSSLFQ